jgi:murein DD-endopeptidase MepM/ murein hydrolase activator NlpD
MILCIIFSFYLLFLDTHVYAATEYYIDVPVEEDTYIEENFPSVSPWNNRNWYIGTDTYYSKGKTRTLVHVNFAQLRNKGILPNDIVDVKIIAHAYLYEGSSGSVTIDAYSTTSVWNMYDVTWQLQPSITSKKDSASITTSASRKEITITNAFKSAYSNTTLKSGILLKMNPESGKALIFWAHGCDIAPSPPICDAIQKPYIRVFYEKNAPPALCTLKLPNVAVTNNPEIPLQAAVSSDKEGDKVTYTGRLCKTIDCQIIEWQSPIQATEKTVTILPDGSYFASCSATDEHQLESWGEPIAITVDTSAPDAPVIHNEPEFTGTPENTIFWQQTVDCNEYQLLSSERAGFTSYNTYSPWGVDSSYTVLHTKEKQYYYKVRCRDSAKNESEWSASTTTIIDSTFPVVNYFKVNKTLLSPKQLKDGTIDNSSYIQGSIADQTVSDLTITIYNNSNKLVYTVSTYEKSYLWIHWPDRLGYDDGVYRAVLSGTDSLERKIESDPLFITIDTTPPKKAYISGIENSKAYGKQKLHVYTSCAKGEIETVYLSNKIIAEDTSQYTLAINQPDGTRKFKATCRDLAGNVSTIELTFTIDTTPPSVPSITAVIDANKVTAKVYCRESGTAQFFVNGVLIGQPQCVSSKYSEIAIDLAVHNAQILTVTARVSDVVGNWSNLGEKTVFISQAEKQEKEFTSKCAITYNIDTQETVTSSCVWPTESLLQYTNTVEQKQESYISTLRVKKYNRNAVITLNIIGCKNRSIWDPRTWFTCITESLSQDEFSGAFIPSFSSKYDLQNISSTELAVVHKRVASIDVTENGYVTFSRIFGVNNITQTVVSQKREYQIELQYKKAVSKAYFAWLFAKNTEVSQWHGNTTYQKPHAGIDFSVYKESVIAPAAGTVVAATYSKKSSCFAGGNYIALKHANGLYTYYFHLATLNQQQGTTWKSGDIVKQGTKFTTTGNSGMYNCEQLAYHLHFEVRTSQQPANHVNPVPYFAINWSDIRTAKSDRYPGRLTGDNPHPKY